MSENKDVDQNEGEGSRSAARDYERDLKQTLGKGHVADDAEAARRDVESNPEEYRRAEEEGKSHSAGEAPGDLG